MLLPVAWIYSEGSPSRPSTRSGCELAAWGGRLEVRTVRMASWRTWRIWDDRRPGQNVEPKVFLGDPVPSRSRDGTGICRGHDARRWAAEPSHDEGQGRGRARAGAGLRDRGPPLRRPRTERRAGSGAGGRVPRRRSGAVRRGRSARDRPDRRPRPRSGGAAHRPRRRLVHAPQRFRDPPPPASLRGGRGRDRRRPPVLRGPRPRRARAHAGWTAAHGDRPGRKLRPWQRMVKRSRGHRRIPRGHRGRPSPLPRGRHRDRPRGPGARSSTARRASGGTASPSRCGSSARWSGVPTCIRSR